MTVDCVCSSKIRYFKYLNMMRNKLFFFILCCWFPTSFAQYKPVPLVINTWAFTNATATAWDAVIRGKSALDVVVAGCSQCEQDQCDYTVGYGGSPDEEGETTLDAMIMDGVTHDIGAVGSLRKVKNAISVARKVLDHTDHTILVGDQATSFAVSMGFKEENLSTYQSFEQWKHWKGNSCQPNFRKNVIPDPHKFCGPYKPFYSTQLFSEAKCQLHRHTELKHHDTIGMIAIDKNGHIAAGTSSNGAKFKIPGRVGDAPIPGAGGYADQDIGAAVATGDGDVMMRFLPSFKAVDSIRMGFNATQAVTMAITPIIRKFPNFSGAILATTINGEIGAACYGMPTFPFSIVNNELGTVTVKTVPCIKSLYA